MGGATEPRPLLSHTHTPFALFGLLPIFQQVGEQIDGSFQVSSVIFCLKIFLFPSFFPP